MLSNVGVHFGCDPEFFFLDANGEVVGSEKIIPEDGLVNHYGKIVRDGVQAELNPAVSGCRQTMGTFIAKSFKQVQEKLVKEKLNYKISLGSVVEVSDKEFNSLSERSKIFGCAPSFNAYNAQANVGVDASVYRKRAAGGHVHIGSLPGVIYWDFSVQGRWGGPKENGKLVERDQRARLIPILDALVGNTLVLIDRDPGQIERRKYYGRAGEYRLPKHGLEYRTLSNFWLKHYILMSLTFGLVRQGVAILYTTLLPKKDPKRDYERFLLENIDFPKMIEAINTNNVELAMVNFEVVKKFITDHVTSDQFSLNTHNLLKFEKMAKKVQKNGLDSLFPTNFSQHWLNPDLSIGWEHYAETKL